MAVWIEYLVYSEVNYTFSIKINLYNEQFNIYLFIIFSYEIQIRYIRLYFWGVLLFIFVEQR